MKTEFKRFALRILALGLIPWSVIAADPPVAVERSADELVLQLGSENFKEREQAEALLYEMGEKATEALKKNANSKNPEIAMRVRLLLSGNTYYQIKDWFVKKKKLEGFADEAATKWPCVVELTEFDKPTGKFTGTIEWKSLGSLVRIEGTLSEKQLVFKEVEFIRHGNSLLNCVYTFDLKADANKPTGKIHGTWKNPDDNRGGRAELAPIQEPADP